jgi:hypothetical protein
VRLAQAGLVPVRLVPVRLAPLRLTCQQTYWLACAGRPC